MPVSLSLEKGGWWRSRMGKSVLECSLSTTPPLEGSQERLTVTTADWWDGDCQLDLFWNASGGQKWRVFPLDAEVSTATSQASLSYLCQVTAREQSKEQWCWDHVSVIPPLRKVIETIYRNLDSLPVISIPHNKPVSPQEESTFTLRHKTAMLIGHFLNVYRYLEERTFLLTAVLFMVVYFIITNTERRFSALTKNHQIPLCWWLSHSVPEKI